MKNAISLALLPVAVLLFFVLVYVAEANHAWSVYHWGRTTSSFPLEFGDNVTTKWDSHLALASSDWSTPSVLDTVIVSGNGGRNCQATTGKVEVCNAKYGANGWLGIAQIWVSGEHITKGVVKMNDTYFDTTYYNTPAWKNLVMCQEIGHTLGLGHTDENFGNTPEGTCMDYSNDPEPNQHPNQHDYDMLTEIYAHLDDTNTYVTGGSTSGKGKGKPSNVGQTISLDTPSEWGAAVREDVQGNKSLYARKFKDETVFTFVTWVNGHHDHE